MEGLESHACHVTDLYQTFIEYSNAGRDEEVCSNSVYGLGLLTAQGGPIMLR